VDFEERQFERLIERLDLIHAAQQQTNTTLLLITELLNQMSVTAQQAQSDLDNVTGQMVSALSALTAIATQAVGLLNQLLAASKGVGPGLDPTAVENDVASLNKSLTGVNAQIAALQAAIAADTPPPAQVTVPNVVGQTQAAATSALTAAGLTLGAVTTGDGTTTTPPTPSGSVMSQSPAAGATAASGSAVALVVAQ
jgi:PASTA domain